MNGCIARSGDGRRQSAGDWDDHGVQNSQYDKTLKPSFTGAFAEPVSGNRPGNQSDMRSTGTVWWHSRQKRPFRAFALHVHREHLLILLRSVVLLRSVPARSAPDPGSTPMDRLWEKTGAGGGVRPP